MAYRIVRGKKASTFVLAEAGDCGDLPPPFYSRISAKFTGLGPQMGGCVSSLRRSCGLEGCPRPLRTWFLIFRLKERIRIVVLYSSRSKKLLVGVSILSSAPHVPPPKLCFIESRPDTACVVEDEGISSTNALNITRELAARWPVGVCVCGLSWWCIFPLMMRFSIRMFILEEFL